MPTWSSLEASSDKISDICVGELSLCLAFKLNIEYYYPLHKMPLNEDINQMTESRTRTTAIEIRDLGSVWPFFVRIFSIISFTSAAYSNRKNVTTKSFQGCCGILKMCQVEVIISGIHRRKLGVQVFFYDICTKLKKTTKREIYKRHDGPVYLLYMYCSLTKFNKPK